jgi:hypothetical protein
MFLILSLITPPNLLKNPNLDFVMLYSLVAYVILAALAAYAAYVAFAV